MVEIYKSWILILLRKIKKSYYFTQSVNSLKIQHTWKRYFSEWQIVPPILIRLASKDFSRESNRSKSPVKELVNSDMDKEISRPVAVPVPRECLDGWAWPRGSDWAWRWVAALFESLTFWWEDSISESEKRRSSFDCENRRLYLIRDFENI